MCLAEETGLLGTLPADSLVTGSRALQSLDKSADAAHVLCAHGGTVCSDGFLPGPG